ncbi:NnrU family protein [Novosphingobium taihuense]|uniref:Putative membrane protein n=1 Tax=Novosphingobium taihuense TaxID=260085 RepID=A0A7W7ACW8_9SPHN|nr:NnrU family protein [Novosphingobium taihuense]MBB4614647.1 putative membrane protein [Novosphingobium taihuense]TWH86111.1 putative membrane protein [Novosphingobium taihuense]
MSAGLIHLILATVAFVVTHFLMSGPLRRPLVRMLGEQGFLLAYSLVSISTLAWVIVVFDRTDSDWAAWNGTAPLTWAIASLLTLIGLALLIPSFVHNPALPGKKTAGLGTVAPVGVFKVTRHPMMWGIALWALGHMIAAPTARVLILMTGLIVLALVGSHFQDKRKLAGNKREVGPWQRRTTFWPNLGELLRLRSILLLGLLVWFIITWVHYHLFGIPAGLWLWVA